MIDKLYYINLDKRKDRLEHLRNNVLPFISIPDEDKQKFVAFDHTHFDNVSQRAAGCSLSHLSIWKEAVKEEYDKILIIEDDFEFVESPEIFNSVLETLQNIDFSICNLSYNNMSSLLPANYEGFFRCNNVQTTSCYVANVKFLNLMIPIVEEATLRLMNKQPYHLNAIDQVWKVFQNRADWIVSKRLGKQLCSVSDIERTKVNYGV